MAIGGYGHALELLGEAVREKEVEETWSDILKEKKLWKLLKHSNHYVREREERRGKYMYMYIITCTCTCIRSKKYMYKRIKYMYYSTCTYRIFLDP